MGRRRIADYVPLALATLLFLVSMGLVLPDVAAGSGRPATSMGTEVDR
jgi:hypothetical protein